MGNLPTGSQRYDVAWESPNGYRLIMSTSRRAAAEDAVRYYLRRHDREVVILELTTAGPDRTVAGRYARKWSWWPFWIVEVAR